MDLLSRTHARALRHTIVTDWPARLDKRIKNSIGVCHVKRSMNVSRENFGGLRLKYVDVQQKIVQHIERK